jgi:hypothetical protein
MGRAAIASLGCWRALPTPRTGRARQVERASVSDAETLAYQLPYRLDVGVRVGNTRGCRCIVGLCRCGSETPLGVVVGRRRSRPLSKAACPTVLLFGAAVRPPCVNFWRISVVHLDVSVPVLSHCYG